MSSFRGLEKFFSVCQPLCRSLLSRFIHSLIPGPSLMSLAFLNMIISYPKHALKTAKMRVPIYTIMCAMPLMSILYHDSQPPTLHTKSSKKPYTTYLTHLPSKSVYSLFRNRFISLYSNYRHLLTYHLISHTGY